MRPSGNTAGTATTAIRYPAPRRPGPNRGQIPGARYRAGVGDHAVHAPFGEPFAHPRAAAAASISQPTRLPGTAKVMIAPTTAIAPTANADDSAPTKTAVPTRS